MRKLFIADETIAITNILVADENWYVTGECYGFPDKTIGLTSLLVADKNVAITSLMIADKSVCITNASQLDNDTLEKFNLK